MIRENSMAGNQWPRLGIKGGETAGRNVRAICAWRAESPQATSIRRADPAASRAAWHSSIVSAIAVA